MKAKSLVFFLMACFTFVSVFTKAQATASDKEAMAMLKNFYTAYMTEVSDGETGRAFEKKLDMMKKKHCTAKFISRIHSLGDQLDADPIIKAQDSSAECIKTLFIKPDAKKANHYLISYTDGVSKVSLHVSVIKQNGSYMIDNIW